MGLQDKLKRVARQQVRKRLRERETDELLRRKVDSVMSGETDEEIRRKVDSVMSSDDLPRDVDEMSLEELRSSLADALEPEDNDTTE